MAVRILITRAVGMVAAISVAVGAVGCATLAPCPAKGGPVWRQFSSEHFHLRTDLDVADATNLIGALEETRAAMLVGAWGGADGPPGRAEVIAFASNSQLAVFASGLGGIHIHRPPFAPTMVISGAGDGFGDGVVLKHELAHDLSRWFLPLQPSWYAEGMATFLETIRYDKQQRRVFVGEASSGRASAIQHSGILPLDLLFAPAPRDLMQLGFFESSCWILVHYLINHREPAFKRFQVRLGALEPPDQAWQAEFPDLDREALYRTLIAYVQSGQYVVMVRKQSPWKGNPDVRTMADAEVHGLRAYLYAYAYLGGARANSDDAHLEVDEALREEDGALEASAVAFYGLQGGKQGTRASSRAALAAGAARAHPDAWMAWLMVADAAPNLRDPAARAALERALQLAPYQPEVAVRLAAAKALAGDWPGTLTFATKALHGGAVRDDLLVLYLAALAQNGHCVEAALWEAAVARYLAPTQAQWVTARWTVIRKACYAKKAAERTPAPGNESSSGAR